MFLLQSRRRKSESNAVFSLRVTILQRALDLASAVATHLDAVGTASRQAASPLGQSTYCFTYASLPSQARLWSLPRPLLQGPQPLCGIPPKEAHPLRNSQAGRYPASQLRTPASRGDCAISRRTVMNNTG